MTISGLELAFITKHISWDCLSVSLNKEKQTDSEWLSSQELVLAWNLCKKEEEEENFVL